MHKKYFDLHYITSVAKKWDNFWTCFCIQERNKEFIKLCSLTNYNSADTAQLSCNQKHQITIRHSIQMKGKYKKVSNQPTNRRTNQPTIRLLELLRAAKNCSVQSWLASLHNFECLCPLVPPPPNSPPLPSSPPPLHPYSFPSLRDHYPCSSSSSSHLSASQGLTSVLQVNFPLTCCDTFPMSPRPPKASLILIS